MNIFKKVYNALDSDYRKRSLTVVVLNTGVAFVEILGIASIIPFIALLNEPDIIEESQILAQVFDFFGFENAVQMLFLLGCLSLFLLLTTNSLKAIANFKSIKYSFDVGHDISMKLFKYYLYQPYASFTSRKNSFYIGVVLNEANRVAANVIAPTLSIISDGIGITLILVFLFVLEPLISLTIAPIFCVTFTVLYMVLKKQAKIAGITRTQAYNSQYAILRETYTNIKNTFLMDGFETYRSQYQEQSYIGYSAIKKEKLLGELPKFFIEVLAFGSVLLIILIFLSTERDMNTVLPLLSAYAFAGYRLVPQFMRVYKSLIKIRAQKHTLPHIFDALKFCNSSEIDRATPRNTLNFTGAVCADNIEFSYGDEVVFKNLCFEINRGDKIALIGPSGSGKSTLLDVISGLRCCTSGKLTIDDKELSNKNAVEWRQNCAFVSQEINLTYGTIKNNIAFGVPPDLIDDERVLVSAKQAQIHDFISSLPSGYDTDVTERDNNFSGGQKQRIAIARALYMNRPVLLLDEATSALDEDTESEILNVLLTNDLDKTVIAITHRLKPLSLFDKIINLGESNETNK